MGNDSKIPDPKKGKENTMKKLIAKLSVVMGSLFVTAVAFAEGPMGATSSDGSLKSVLAIGSALAIAIAAAAGTVSQSKAAIAALEGISRNPGAAGKVQTPMIIALALIESLVIYAFVIAILLQGKI